jgi:hypothetical protein
VTGAGTLGHPQTTKKGRRPALAQCPNGLAPCSRLKGSIRYDGSRAGTRLSSRCPESFRAAARKSPRIVQLAKPPAFVSSACWKGATTPPARRAGAPQRRDTGGQWIESSRGVKGQHNPPNPPTNRSDHGSWNMSCHYLPSRPATQNNHATVEALVSCSLRRIMKTRNSTASNGRPPALSTCLCHP